VSQTSAVLQRARHCDLTSIVAERGVIVCTGPGGVGKTTTAAALAVVAARRGRRTLVLTIDPARRLAQALGMRELGNEPHPVAEVNGLDAMMLDMKRTFDAVIDQYALDSQGAERIKANRFYKQLSDSLAGTQEYMAMEKLYELYTYGGYDCLVVDTPPTRNALDFLDAPKRLTDFLEGRFLTLFLSQGMSAGRAISRMAALGSGLFLKLASRVTGVQVLEDLGEFFASFEGMYEGFKDRAQAVYRLLGSPTCAFVVVASPQPPALREARYFLQRLAQDGMPTAGLIVNRTTPALPAGLSGLNPALVAAATLRLAGGGPEQRAAAALLGLAVDCSSVHRREQQAIAAALDGVDPKALVEVPLLPTDVHSVSGLTELGAYLVQD
jgi:anion-transporting  ArsA/GET3 family ATPase